ncbi:MAG: molybdopterin molybdotransferase MoeA [Rhodoferax sp.]|nr:molybdopterin molybdotransferase MoeA [Rhodoferax sp.]
MTPAPRSHMLPLLPLDEALERLLAFVGTPLDSEPVRVGDADGRVLAQDVVSALQVPPQDNSAMDGYALRCAEALTPGTELPVSQRIAAGTSGTVLEPGSAARIFTGAPIPPGADAVVMQEDCTALEGGSADDSARARVRINTIPKPGQNIRRAGEDVAHGAVVLTKGVRLGPAALGLAASIGMDRLHVARRPRVALFSTGDELVMPGTVDPAHMPPGVIYNSNRFVLNALLRRMGCVVSDLGTVPDQRAATVLALQEAAHAHDVILTSGGVSVGEEDHVKPAVQTLGTLDLWHVAIKPGKPFAHGRINQAHFMGLPGNPVASLVTFLVLVRPFLLRLQGVPQVSVRPVVARANFTWAKADKRREFLRVRHNPDGGLDLFPNQGSGVLTSVAWGDGLVDNPPGRTIAPGDPVHFISFAELLA